MDLLGRAEASPTIIVLTRKSPYLCMYVCVCVCVCMYVAIHRPRAHYARARITNVGKDRQY